MDEEPSTSGGSTRSISQKRQDEVDVMAAKPPEVREGIKLSIPLKLQDKNDVIFDKHPVVTAKLQALDDRQKRWLIVGICLQKIVLPALRQYIIPILTDLYNELMLKQEIETQTYETHLTRYAAANTDLNYEAVNNNKATHGNQRAKYDYTIKSVIDLSKLFLPTHMALDTDFHETCDLSTCLGLIINTGRFPVSVSSCAENVRSVIRNPWVHCNFTEWDEFKYSHSFQLMEQLVKTLRLSSYEKSQIIMELRGWKINAKTSDSDDNEKRWMVVGICMNTVLIPALRKYVVPILTVLYNELTRYHNIDTQIYPTHYQPTNRFLNYGAVNNNKARFGKKQAMYDYTIKSVVDLSKLFLPTHMAHYTGFDETCDISALLGMIINIDKFPQIVKSDAEEVRRSIQNPWTRGNCTQWDAVQYSNSFQLMRKIVKDLSLSLNEENQIIEEMKEWEINDPDLLPFAGTSEDFRKLLSTGTYESFENRVFLCGSCACGKSTLASVLIGTPIPLTWKSTDGLVIHFGRNGINLESFEMVPLKEENRGHNVLTKLVIGKPNREITKCQTIDNHHDLCFAPSSNDLTELNLQDSEIDANFSSEVSVSTEDDIGEYEVLSREQFSTSEMNNTSSISLPNVKTVEAYAVHDDILKEVESGQYKVKIAPSDLVDFGGQRSYDMTHQLFVQHGGTFVVMFDGSRDFQEPLTEYPTGDISNETIVKHWVNSILTYCVDDRSVMPKILFAATHRDILTDDMQKKKNREFVQRVTEMFGTHEMNKHIVFNPVFFINGTDKDDQEIQNLKNHIVTIARHQPSWGLRRPMIWVPIELMIDNMIKDNINIIPKTYLVEANTMNKDLALSDKQMSEFLLTQHALGKIMYFDQQELNNFIILYPPALVNILRSFITDEMFWPNDETLRSILRGMTETGKIHKTDLIKLWQQKQFVHHIPSDDYKEFIIQVLVHLDILVMPKRYSGQDETHVDYFLVPCTVKHKMPMSFLDDKSFANRTIALVYHIRQSSIPSALSFKLIGAVSGIWPIKEVNERPLLYHSSAVLCVDSQTEFRIMVEDNKIVVYLTNMSSRSCISPDIAASIQDCLTVTLQAVLKFYLISIGKNYQQVNVSNLFHIEVGEVCCRSPCVISISKAKQTPEWVCNNGNTHFSRDPLLWIFNKTHQECSSNCPGLDESVLTISPSEQHLSRLAYQLNIQSCRELIINLGIQLNDWEDIEYSYTRMPLIIKIMALNFWKTKNIVGRPNKSFNNLLDALKAVGDTRHLLCKVFREYTHLLDIADVRLQEVPDDDVLQGLPKNLGNCAIPLGIELGISISSIEETMTRHPRDMYNQISDILRKWKTSTCSREVKPTIYKLMLALERVHTGGLDYLKDIYLGQ
ncbi:uncharacterized protein [Mytilus edulis]|uniref:uncharacterized protein isoform X3 n=1 Tax=Mytilus edulis TaxID=6550 RepID=UPI0039EE55D4